MLYFFGLASLLTLQPAQFTNHAVNKLRLLQTGVIYTSVCNFLAGKNKTSASSLLRDSPSSRKKIISRSNKKNRQRLFLNLQPRRHPASPQKKEISSKVLLFLKQSIACY